MTTPTIFAIDFRNQQLPSWRRRPRRVFAPIPSTRTLGSHGAAERALATRLADGGTFGANAVREFVANGFRGRLIRSVKRHLPSRSFTKTRIGHQFATLEDLIGAFLRSMRESACRHFDADVRRVVLGRPARFSNEPEEDALAETRLSAAARKAGFEEVTFCPEPLAAAYDFVEDLAVKRTVLIADLGGGTSDYTLVRMDADGFRPEDVLGIGGVSVAGDAIDGSLVRSEIAPHLGSQAKYRVPLGPTCSTCPTSSSSCSLRRPISRWWTASAC